MDRNRKAVAALAAALFAAPPLAAADFVVTRYDDPSPNGCAAGDCSLREAVMASNFDPDFDRILLSAGRYELALLGVEDDAASGDFDLNRDVEIVGPGAGLTIIDGNLLDGVFQIRQIADATFRGLTILGGISVGGRAFGIHVGGTSALVEDCEVRGDEPGTTGNAIQASGTPIVIRRSTIVAAPGTGLNISNSSSALLENVTIAGSGNNEIFGLTTSTFNILNSTIVSTPDANSDVVLQNGSSLQIQNSIVAGGCSVSTSTITSLGGNIQADPGTSCGFTQTFDQSIANANLATLGDHGGSTRTMEPLPGSLAIDTSSDTNCLDDDARGVVRPQDGDGVNDAHCDSGAVEVAATNPPTPIFIDGFLQGDQEAWSASEP